MYECISINFWGFEFGSDVDYSIVKWKKLIMIDLPTHRARERSPDDVLISDPEEILALEAPKETCKYTSDADINSACSASEAIECVHVWVALRADPERVRHHGSDVARLLVADVEALVRLFSHIYFFINRACFFNLLVLICP
jgi:hypothetical protein